MDHQAKPRFTREIPGACFLNAFSHLVGIFLCIWSVIALKEASLFEIWGPGLAKRCVSLFLGPSRKRPSNTLAAGPGRHNIQQISNLTDLTAGAK